jgi:hypothetical protein
MVGNGALPDDENDEICEIDFQISLATIGTPSTNISSSKYFSVHLLIFFLLHLIISVISTIQ